MDRRGNKSSQAQWVWEGSEAEEDGLSYLDIGREWFPIFEYRCNDSSYTFYAGCLAGSLEPGFCVDPPSCPPSQPTVTEHCCTRFEWRSLAHRFGLAAVDQTVCASAFPWQGYISGNIEASGRSTLKLVWIGSSPPPTEVRVITCFQLNASAGVSDTALGCTDASEPSTLAESLSAVNGGPGFIQDGELLSNTAKASVSTPGRTADETRYALSRVWVLRVERDADGRFYVKVPYEIFGSAYVAQSPRGSYSCDHIPCGIMPEIGHPRRPGYAASELYRAFDVFTSGDEIYLVSSTSLIDGADALGCAAEFCGMRPVTGQVSSAVPFPAVDTVNVGWTYTTSPIPAWYGGGQLPTDRPGIWFGLNTIRLIVLNSGEVYEGLLESFWRGTATEWTWQLRGSRFAMDELLPERVREILIYDVDGTALRFLGKKRPDGSWEYHPAFGVFARLEGGEEAFVLHGGAPGNMRAKGGWRYYFEPVEQGGGEFDRRSRHAFCWQIVDPLGVAVTMVGRDFYRTIQDPISGSSMQISSGFGSTSVIYSHPQRGSADLFSYLSLGNGALIGDGDETLVYMALRGWNDEDLIRLTSIGDEFGISGEPAVEEVRGWTPIFQGERELLNYSGADWYFVQGGRLSFRTWGNLIPYTYSYEWVDPLRFRIRVNRDAFRSELTYLTDESKGKFLEATYVRPSLSGQTERFVYRFNQTNGQVDRVRFFASVEDERPKWEIDYTFGEPNDPLAITQVEQRYPSNGITRTWGFSYTERNGETLLQSVHDPTGVSAHVEYENPDFPVLPSAVRNAVNHRWEMTYTAPGLLQTFKEPDRAPWTFSYYPQGHPFENKLEQLTDPTGRWFRVSNYDLFGRPTRIEVPLSDRLLWQEIEWTLMGAPRRVSWSDNSQVNYYWHGPGLRGMEDARGRKVWFDYNLQPELGKAGLLNQIRLGGSWDDINSGSLFAALQYDGLGRLTRVAGGNNVGVNYTYGIRDQLRFVQYDGDSRPEEFTYSCCGELESWRRQDGRTAYFEYEGGLLKHIRLNSPLNQPAYTFGYDLAGRLKSAQSQTSRHQWIYEYELGVNTSRLSQEQNQVYGAGISYTHAYTYYPSGEVQTAQLDVSLTQGGYQRTLTYWYDDAGRLTDIFYNGQQLASYSYDSAGRLQSQTVRPLGTNATLTTTLTYADAQSVGAIGKVEWRWNGQALALFNYEGYDNQRGYYPDGTLARAQETLAGQPTRFWEWDYDEKGQLAYEKRREGNGSWSQTNFTYDAGGNLWGDRGWRYRNNQLWYVPRDNQAWYFSYTRNGERFRQWTIHSTSDVLGIIELSWEYAYDIWGNLIVARSPAGTYRAGYDALGRRLWEEVQTAQGTRRTYFLYEGDTSIGEVSPEGVYEYVWGLLGPIARIDLQNPANTRYYVLDGLGHVRMLVSPSGNATDVYHYDSWGNPIPTGMESTRQPFRWNGAFGYTYNPFTGLYHLNPDYDPKTGRYLQRQGSNPANPATHADNDPINNIDSNLRWGHTIGNNKLVQRASPEQGQRIAEQLRDTAYLLLALDPITGAVEVLTGKDCYGEDLSTGERILIIVTIGKGSTSRGLLARVWNWVSGLFKRAPKNPLTGIRYTQKVQGQMRNMSDPFHAFPLVVDNYAVHGQVTQLRGRDGIVRTVVRLEGVYRGYEGYFEWIIEPDGTCNHRLFKPVRKLP